MALKIFQHETPRMTISLSSTLQNIEKILQNDHKLA
jgi:hypothetical protein